MEKFKNCLVEKNIFWTQLHTFPSLSYIVVFCVFCGNVTWWHTQGCWMNSSIKKGKDKFYQLKKDPFTTFYYLYVNATNTKESYFFMSMIYKSYEEWTFDIYWQVVKNKRTKLQKVSYWILLYPSYILSILLITQFFWKIIDILPQ